MKSQINYAHYSGSGSNLEPILEVLEGSQLSNTSRIGTCVGTCLLKVGCYPKDLKDSYVFVLHKKLEKTPKKVQKFIIPS
jgi:hypothetical protein